ncbi:MAG: plastocyanin/azurin family copper-binding protein [Ignavibacteriales bacterium]
MNRYLNRPVYYFSIAAVFAVMIFISGCKKDDTPTNSTPGGSTNPNEVVMQNMTFAPASLTVTAGTTVTWVNKDSYAHTVTSGTPGSPDGKFDSGSIAGATSTTSGGSGGGGAYKVAALYSFKFDTKGSYPYYCRFHSGMVGTITVQ